MSPRQRLGNALLAAIVTVVVGSPARGDEADDQYAIAAGHYAQKRWKFAAEELETFIERFPNHTNTNQSVFYLGEALLQLGQPEQAGARFREYLERDPDGRYARPAEFRAGESAYLAGDREDAKARLEAFRQRYPDDKLNAYALSYLGEVFLSEQDYGQAEQCFRRVLSDFPGGGQQDACRFGLARALEKLGKHSEAERLFLAVAGKTGTPLADDAQFHLGALQYATGRFEESVATFNAFESRLSASPRRTAARLGRGWALVKLGRLEEAERSFESIVADPRVGIDARYWLGLTQKAQQEWQSAAETLLEAVQSNPDHKLMPALRVHAGHALLGSGDVPGAVKQFDLVLDSPAPDGEWIDDAIRGKIQAALRAKDHDAVERSVSEFTGRFPESPLGPDIDRMLGQSLIERKQFDNAIGVLEPLLEREADQDDLTEVRYLLSLAYEGVERRDDALAMLDPVLKRASGELRSDAQLARASLLVAMKRFQEAIDPLNAFLATAPTGDAAVKALGQLAICHARVGRLDEARDVYRRLIEQHPSHDLIVPITEQMAEAAYDANEMGWSTRLYEWLGSSSRSAEYERKGLSGLAWSQYQSGRLEEAEATFEKLLAKDPEPALAAEAALARGHILQKLERSAPALEMFNLVVEEFPESEQHPEALLAAARLHDDLGQDDSAAALYERLAREYPETPGIDGIFYRWAWTLEDLARPAEAAELFTRVYRDYPHSQYWPDAAYRMADRAYREGQFADADEIAAAILSAKAEDALRQNVLFLQGQIAAAENRWAQATEAFQKLIDEYPSSELRLHAEYGIAEATFRRNDHEAASAQFERLVEQTRDRREPWIALFQLRLAQSLAQQKKWDEAYEVAATIEERFPAFEEQYEADLIVGRCLAAKADFDGAREAYRKVYESPYGEKTETAAEARFLSAETHFHQKNYGEALREYLALEILYAYPVWQAVAVLQAGKCHEKLGEWNDAVKQYAKVVESYGDTKYADEARALLETAQQKAGPPPTG